MLKVANTVEDVMLRVKHLIKKEGEDLMSEAVKVFADEAKTAILDFPEEYRTKTINLGGMLIEASNRAEIEQRLPMEIVLPRSLSDLRYIDGIIDAYQKQRREEEDGYRIYRMRQGDALSAAALITGVAA